MRCRTPFVHKSLAGSLLASLLLHCVLGFALFDAGTDGPITAQTPCMVSLIAMAGGIAEEGHPVSPAPPTTAEIVEPTLPPPAAPVSDSVATGVETREAAVSKPSRIKTRIERDEPALADEPPAIAHSLQDNKQSSVTPRPAVEHGPSRGAAAPAASPAPSAETSAMGSASGDDSGVVQASFGEDDGPRLVSMPTLHYPQRARRLRQEGRVLLLLELDSSGGLKDVSILESAGFGFDEVALEAVAMARFRPAERNGRRVACRAALPIAFRLH